MPSGVLIAAETRDGTLRSVTAEAVSTGRRLADSAGATCSAVLVGGGVSDKAAQLGTWGAQKVYVADHEALKAYSGRMWLEAVKRAVAMCDPAVVLLSATSTGKDLAPRIAAALGAGYASGCTQVELDDGALVATRPVYAGKAFQRVRVTTPVAVASLRPKNFEVSETQGETAEVVAIDGDWSDSQAGVIAQPVTAGEGGKVDLTEADRIVSGGRGMGGPENWGILEDLASAMDAVLGASRAVVDAGWRPHAEQVGQTGKTVTPQLYVACAISGAMQHLAGMSRSKTIVAINKDPEAPIFGVADYGLVGDVTEILPALAAEVRKHSGD